MTKAKYIVIYGTAKGKSQYIVYKRKAVKNIELALEKQQDFLKYIRKKDILYAALNQHESHENSHKYKVLLLILFMFAISSKLLRHGRKKNIINILNFIRIHKIAKTFCVLYVLFFVTCQIS